MGLETSEPGRAVHLGLDTFPMWLYPLPIPTLAIETLGEQESSLCMPSSSCLSGDDSSTCIGILAKEVEIVASSDSSISSKARGSNKVSTRMLWHVWPTQPLPPLSLAASSYGDHLNRQVICPSLRKPQLITKYL